MMKVQQNNTNKGIGFCGLLGVAFIVLKLCNVIDWSWWWVLLPIYGPLALAVLVILIVFILSCVKGS